MTPALIAHAQSLLRRCCAQCGSGKIPTGGDDHPAYREFGVLVPKLLACATAPHRWYGAVVAVFCSPACGLKWREAHAS